jgi:UDP-glucose 4-epimerase/UDP-glucuronate decarboxylase
MPLDVLVKMHHLFQPTHVRFSYGTSKFMGEVLCTQFGRRFGVPCTVVRYHNVYGPRMGERHVIPEFIARARRKEDPFDVYGSHETRAFCYIDDAVDATIRIAATPACANEILHVGNPREEIRIVDLAKLVMALTGHQATIRERPSRGGSVSRRCPNTAKLKRLTGCEAAVSVRDGICRMLAGDHARQEDVRRAPLATIQGTTPP